MSSSTDWERIVLPKGPGAVNTDGLCASVNAMELTVRPGADLFLLDHAAIRLVEKVVLHDDEAPRRALLARGKSDPVFAARLLTDILPNVARRLDSGWAEDRLSFVDVTIAAARVQDALRVLGRVTLPTPEANAIALIVPSWEQHTLAAAFAAQAMRDMGAQVRIITGPTITTIAAIVARAPVQAIMVSVSGEAALDRTPDFLTKLKKAMPLALPVVVGGAVAEEKGAARCPRGADLMTNDFGEALGFCKIPLSRLSGEKAVTDAL
ncbi:MAG: hypothetical protein AAGF30_06610 [Pseudomonadota bacterium]